MITTILANVWLLAAHDVEGAAATHGADAGFAGHFGLDLPNFISQLLIFSILLFVLDRFAFKPILAMLDERKRRIEESIANAERIRVELDAAEKTRLELITKANQDATRLIEEAKQSADVVGGKRIQEATAQAEALIRKAEEASALDRDRIMNELKQELGRLVVSTTSRVVGKVLTAEDQARLQKEAAQGVAGRN